MTSPDADGAALRREDPPLVTGSAHYTDDLAPPGALHAVFVRAPLAHGRILGIDPVPAAGLPGVAGVFTAADLDLPPMPAGGAPEAMARPVLASDTVRFLGEAAIHQLLAESTLDTRSLLARVNMLVRSHVGDAEPFDDITLMVLHRTDPRAGSRSARPCVA